MSDCLFLGLVDEYDCLFLGLVDEYDCLFLGPVDDPRYNNRTAGMIDRVSRVLRFYEDSSWAWKEYFTK